MGPLEQSPGGGENSPHWSIGQALFGLATTAVRSVPRDLSLTSLSTLATLERCGPRRITDLAVTEGVAQPSMTALVSGLERSDLVERRSHPTDKRVSLVALTETGSDFLQARRRAGTESIVRLIGELPSAEIEALCAATTALIHVQDLDEDRWGALTQPSGRLVEGASR
jgi:DNA-binding MarR family transcriptional regulator